MEKLYEELIMCIIIIIYCTSNTILCDITNTKKQLCTVINTISI